MSALRNVTISPAVRIPLRPLLFPGPHSVTTSTSSRRRSTYIVDQYVEAPHPYQRLPIAFSVSNATIHASVSSKVEQQYLGVFDSSEL
jgi:hypothetical protein